MNRIIAACYMPTITRGSDIILRLGVSINISRGLRNNNYRAVGSYWRKACNVTNGDGSVIL
jgi:hypothetical protein